MAFGPNDLAPALLNWRARYRDGMVRWPEPGRTGLRFRFAEHLAAKQRSRHADDYRRAVDAFASDFPSLVHWFAAALAPFEHCLVIEDGAPRLRCGHLGAWRRLASRLDPDALVAFRLAQTLPPGVGAAQAVEELTEWGYFLTMADHGLQRVLSRGIADTHVHFEASDPLPLLWLRLASGRVRAEQLQFYSAPILAGLVEDERERARREEDREILAGARRLRDDLIDRVYAGSSAPTEDPGRGAMAPLVVERELLLSAWRIALDARVSRDFLRVLDAYLFAKGLFLRRHQQSADQGPGLTRFRDFLDRGRTLGDRRYRGEKAVTRRVRYERMISLATESPRLRVVELRVAPQDSLKGWYDLFRVWLRAFKPHRDAFSRRGLEVRFVVHLIRQAETRTDGTSVEFERLRRVVDRQTAILHLFRHAHPDVARHIVGVDAANLERVCPPHVLAPYLQLLRGKPELAGNGDGFARSGLLEAWSRLADRNLLRPPASLPRLGLTYHVGEDFYHPLDGLRAVSGLLDKVLQPGDRIGHGLAVGWDVARFARERGPAPMPRGVLFDNLVWLRRLISAAEAWAGPCQAEIDKRLLELARTLYGADHPPGVLERAQNLRFHTPNDAEPWAGTPEGKLAMLDATDVGVRARRAAFCSEGDLQVLDGATGLIAEAQRRLATRLRDRGIVVEANPTSNLVTGAVDRLEDHPFFRYLEVLDGQVIVSINTDDPGVFGTSLEVEFGLMFEAMLARKHDRGEALDILDRCRRLALDHAFGPPEPGVPWTEGRRGAVGHSTPWSTS